MFYYPNVSLISNNTNPNSCPMVQAMPEVAKSILSDMVCRQQRLRMVVPLGMVAPDMVAPGYGCPPIWLPPDMVTTVAIDPHQESGC